MSHESPPHPPDDEIVALLKADPDRGLRAFLKEYGPSVNGILQRQFNAVLDVEDILQVACIKLLGRLDTFNSGKGRLVTWFLTIAQRAGLDMLRKEKRHQGRLAARAGKAAYDPKYDAELDERIEELYDAVELMKVGQKAQYLILTEWLGGASRDEIAAKLGKTVNAIDASFHKAKATLRRIMTEGKDKV